MDEAGGLGQTWQMATGHAAHRRYTIQEFVRLEEYSNVRHEFLDGQIYAMAGGTPEHGTWAANVIGLLTACLRGRPCRVQTSDVRIRVKATGLDTYPDVSVVCGHAERDVEDRDAIVNPILLVEVLSPSTEEYDRGEKLGHYKVVESLREVVFVNHDERRVEVHRRDGGRWTVSRGSRGESVRLESIGCELPVDEVYRDPLAS
jgi:Uma2 family endonuclease